MKTYHIPDWDKAEKGVTRLTEYALCGEVVDSSTQKEWFGWRLTNVTCVPCRDLWNKSMEEPTNELRNLRR